MLFSLEASRHEYVTVTSPLLHHPTTIPEIFAGPSWATHPPPPPPPRLRDGLILLSSGRRRRAAASGVCRCRVRRARSVAHRVFLIFNVDLSEVCQVQL